MEVHYIPNVERKGFKEYFLEFLMIFLAVTLGFFAENIRERFVERAQEKEYIRSLYDDLGHDENALPVLLQRIQGNIREAGALQQSLPQGHHLLQCYGDPSCVQIHL